MSMTLAHPILAGDPDEALPWRDNAFLAFWDHDAAVFGCVHVSTSPNAEGRRARASVSVRGVAAEIQEELEPGSFASESIDFGLGGRIRVRHRELELDVEMTPRGQIGDYSATGVIPLLEGRAPLQHLQQASLVTGTVTVADRSRESAHIDGVGLRDRTWGYRDESAAFREYVAVMLDVDDVMLTALKFQGVDGNLGVHGFLLGRDEVREAEELTVTRDAAGLLVGATVRLTGGQVVEARRNRLAGGFWVPMGVERTGPTFSAYDEYLEVVCDGRPGAGVVEQGILRQVH